MAECEREGVNIPDCAKWNEQQVADWIESLGFPEYKECFTANLICGRKLICVNASTLPKLGVQDWKHIKIISNAVRDILKQDKPYWNKSISLERCNPLGMELERQSQTTGASSKYF